MDLSDPLTTTLTSWYTPGTFKNEATTQRAEGDDAGTLAQQQSTWLWTRGSRGSTGTPSHLHLNNCISRHYGMTRGRTEGQSGLRGAAARGGLPERKWGPLLPVSRRESGADVRFVYPPPTLGGQADWRRQPSRKRVSDEP
jgi:hypothetical protein